MYEILRHFTYEIQHPSTNIPFHFILFHQLFVNNIDYEWNFYVKRQFDSLLLLLLYSMYNVCTFVLYFQLCDFFLNDDREREKRKKSSSPVLIFGWDRIGWISHNIYIAFFHFSCIIQSVVGFFLHQKNFMFCMTAYVCVCVCSVVFIFSVCCFAYTLYTQTKHTHSGQNCNIEKLKREKKYTKTQKEIS